MFLKYCFAFLKHGSLWTYRAATYAVLITGLVFFTLVIGLRYLVLPYIDDYREPIAQMIARTVGQRVTIGSITGSWQGYRPELTLKEVKVFGSDGQPALALERVSTVLSWFSLLSAELRFDSLEVDGPSLEVKRDAAGVLWVAGIAMQPQDRASGGFGDWLLAQRQVIVRDASITWLDEMRSAPVLRLDKVNFRLDRDGAIHRFGLTAVPPAQIAAPLAVRGEFVGRDVRELQSWNGKLYAEIGAADLALAQAWIPAPLELASGMGSLRLWLELNGTRLGAATADIKLTNVRIRLAPELAELSLSEVHGRLGWAQRDDHMEISATSFGFTAANGLRLAPTHFTYAQSGPVGGVRRSELHFSDLDLAPVVELAEFLPFDAALRGHLAQTALSGIMEDGYFSWNGDWGTGQPYAAKVRFSGMAARPDGMLPGFHGVSGEFDASERGGMVSLTVTSGSLELPKVFAEALPLDFVTINAGWSFRQGVVDVTIKNASFTNEHLAGSVSGSYRGAAEGPGSVDLSGSLVRADAHQVWRYLPASLPVTQAWLKRALVAGESRDTRFRLKGPLKDFPFAGGKNGIFEVVTKASGVTLDFADGWPPITGINGEATFRGNRMDVQVQSGATLGTQLSAVHASIPELDKDTRLLIKGVVNGATPDFLRYAAITPAGSQINSFTNELKAAGEAKLDLELDLPLHEIQKSAVKGELTVQNNQVTLDARLPPFEHFGARIAFTEHDFSVRDGRALMFGEPLSFEVANQADGGITANVAGTLDVDQARTVWNHPLLAFLDGQTSWNGTIGLRNKIATIRFDSNLVGVTSTLPAPFAKAAKASLPLRVELRERPGRQGVLAVNLDKVASVQLLLDASAPGGVSRGMVSLGSSPAMMPTSDGVWIRGSIDLVDVDAWQSMMSGDSSDSQPGLSGVDLQIGILDINRRRFHDLKVDATHQDDRWQATLAGREVAGQISWTSGGDGKLAARLSKLVLPPITTEIQAGRPASGPEQRLPSVDLIADSLTYDGKDLGRLALLAQPDFPGWQLQRLEISNPESKFVMSGRWVVGETSRTDVTVKLDVSDLGKFFARLGWPDTVKGGTAMLEGPLAWSGNPTRFDIPSLSGKLKLQVKDGRFQQIEPGVGKLLGILSLQALPRRVTLDFRDVFSKGFSFDKISADLNITVGIADTKNFLMTGSAAQVTMRGQVDLARETQNLVVRVTPSLSGSIAIAGAIVNPAIGLAALIAQKALRDPFSQLASFEYSVTGTWADPVIAKISRAPPAEVTPGRR